MANLQGRIWLISTKLGGGGFNTYVWNFHPYLPGDFMESNLTVANMFQMGSRWWFQIFVIFIPTWGR